MGWGSIQVALLLGPLDVAAPVVLFSGAEWMGCDVTKVGATASAVTCCNWRQSAVVQLFISVRGAVCGRLRGKSVSESCGQTSGCRAPRNGRRNCCYGRGETGTLHSRWSARHQTNRQVSFLASTIAAGHLRVVVLFPLWLSPALTSYCWNGQMTFNHHWFYWIT